MSIIEFANDSVGTLRESEPFEYPTETINWPVKGTIVNVFATDDPNNLQGEMLCDVQLVDYNYFCPRIPIYCFPFHQDTNPQDKLSRQNRKPKKRMIFSGEAWTPEVGTICIVQFIGPPGPNREAAITGFCPVSNQAVPHINRKREESLFPREAQAVTVFDGDELVEEFRSRLQPTESESPRWTRIQNGTAVEIDNRGNFNVQTTIARVAHE